MIVDEFLPLFDRSDELAVVVDADPASTWAALMEADLLEVGRRAPLAGALGALRMLPELVSHMVHGERPPKAPERLRLRDTADAPAKEGGWVILGERPGQELALGLVGKFWRPVIDYAEVTPEGFRDFTEPGYAKTVYALSVRPLDRRAQRPVGGDAHRDDRRARPALVSPLLDLRGRLGRPHPRPRAAGPRP